MKYEQIVNAIRENDKAVVRTYRIVGEFAAKLLAAIQHELEIPSEAIWVLATESHDRRRLSIQVAYDFYLQDPIDGWFQIDLNIGSAEKMTTRIPLLITHRPDASPAKWGVKLFQHDSPKHLTDAPTELSDLALQVGGAIFAFYNGRFERSLRGSSTSNIGFGRVS